MPGWAYPRAWISRAASSSSPRPHVCWNQAFLAPRYRCKRIHIGGNTDPYQPVERDLGSTRSILEVMRRFNHPFSIITKSVLIGRDADILGPMGKAGLASAFVSITTLDRGLARAMEPRASHPRQTAGGHFPTGGGGLSGRRGVRPGHSRPERPRTGVDSGSCGQGRGDAGHVCDAAPAAGDQGSVPRMAGRRPPGPGRAGHVADPSDPGRPRITTPTGPSG